MPKKSITKLLDEYMALQLAWPEAPAEIFAEMEAELSEAIMRENKTEVRHDAEAIRRTPRPGRSNRPIG
jgi:hypothetical protein